MIRRTGAFLLAAVLLLASWAAAMAEKEPLSEEEELALSMRFGESAEVELDENREPVSVNGYPFRQVETCFNVRAVEEKIVTRTDFLDYPFWRPATEYDGNLALMSLYMALCAARDLQRNEDPKAFDPSQNAEAYLLGAGFTDLRKDDYSKETSLYTISTAMGSRRMEHDGEEPFTLIAVCVCGGEYKNEWQSNLTAGNGDLHEGFRSASDLVIDRIAGYVTTRGLKGRIKVWISGFSRAAAVANLTASRLTHAGAFPKEDVYAYTFATPAAVLNPPESGDENIYNNQSDRRGSAGDAGGLGVRPLREGPVPSRAGILHLRGIVRNGTRSVCQKHLRNRYPLQRGAEPADADPAFHGV